MKTKTNNEAVNETITFFDKKVNHENDSFKYTGFC